MRATPPALVVRHVPAHGRLIFSEATLTELKRRLWRPKFDRYVSVELRSALRHDWAAVAERVQVADASQRFSRDPHDDKFDHWALCGGADRRVKGDADRLDVVDVHAIPILRPSAAARESLHRGT